MKRTFLAILIIGLLTWGFFQTRDDRTDPVSPRLIAPVQDLSGFKRAEGPVPIDFPADHGPHPDYLTEWWYYTGNLDTADGRHYGFQLTFFRRALLPASERFSVRESDWAADQLYLAHFAVSDITSDEFYFDEKFSRGAAGLAGAQAEPFRSWLLNWQVKEVAADTYLLEADMENLKLELTLQDTKGPILQGVDGYSQKGPEPGNASYYISQTRLEARGSIQIEGVNRQINGLVWMDHEYSTSSLGPDQVGWDWFSIQLDNQIELMLFYLRKEDGSIDPFSSGTLIAADGSTRPLSLSDFQIQILDTWVSPHSGAEYPAGWEIVIPDEEIALTLAPYMADQELQVSFTYWEGAVRVQGSVGGRLVTGSGYVEMTGYAQSMQGEF